MIRRRFTRGIAIVLSALMLATGPVSTLGTVKNNAVVVNAAGIEDGEDLTKATETEAGQNNETPAEDVEKDSVPTEKAPTENTPIEKEPSDTTSSNVTRTDAAPKDATPTDATPTDATPTDAAVNLLVSSHVQGIGWQKYTDAGSVSGTLGEGKRIEALRIKMETEQELGIEYRTFIQGKGWEDTWKSSDEISGTVGESKAVEAIEIRLTGKNAEKYDIYYAAHVQKLGWLAYVKNGESAGNTMNLRMEAFSVEIRKKSEDAPANKGSREIGFAKAELTYATHVQGIGWQGYVGNGALSGTSGESRRLEAIKINLNTNLDINVEYRTHIQGIGWESEWKKNNELSGTSGQSKRLEAIQIRLTGSDAKLLDVYYRVHAQKFGWLPFTRNGGNAGTSGFSLRLEALQIQIVPSGSLALEPNKKAFVRESVSYRTHMQSSGWTDVSKNGEPSGVTGAAKRMEAFNVTTDGTMDVTIEYRSHIQGKGWESAWRCEGVMSGTSGEGKRVEAIQIRLRGADSEKFDVYYSAHVQKFGWMGWAKNGEIAGTLGHSLRIEAIRVKIVPRGSAAPTRLGRVSTPKCEARLDYTFSGNARACSFVANVVDSGLSGDIIYRLYEPDDEWMWHRKNGTSMTAVHGAERIQIDLNGQISDYFDVYYRAKVEGYGWTGWAKNGQDAGSRFCDAMIIGVEAKLIPKNEPAPGSTENRTFQNFASQAEANMYRKAQNYYTTNGKLILVSRDDHLVGIFDGYEGNYSVEKFFVCTVGAWGSETITGDFRMGIKMYYFDSDDARMFYASQIYGNYLFHSVLYYQDDYPRTIMDGRLGEHLSHGCVRLDVADAKYIYDNIPSGTRILIYN